MFSVQLYAVSSIEFIWNNPVLKIEYNVHSCFIFKDMNGQNEAIT